MTPVQFSRFDTALLDPAEQFEAWATSIGSIFDVSAPHSTPSHFVARLDSCLVGEQLMLSRCQTHAQHFTRNALRVARDDLDHYVIQTHLSGEQTLKRGKKQNTSRPGILHIIDLTEVHDAQASEFTNLSLVIPRSLLSPLLQQADSQHGRVLSAENGLTHLAIQHLQTLSETLPSLSPEQALLTVEPTVMLLASALNGNPEAMSPGSFSNSPSLLAQAKLLIERHLASNLSVEWLCSRLPVSRASLYRLFEAHGGVRSYIQERRLRRAAQTLMTLKYRHVQIGEIAQAWGFTSESHFARAFRERFGIPPSHARHTAGSYAPTQRQSDLAVGDRDYERWLHDILG